MDTLLVALLAAVFLISLGVLVLLVVVIVGIRAEERHMSLTRPPRTQAGLLARRLTGASVRRPQRASHCHDEHTRR
jgi:hypothetical protein